VPFVRFARAIAEAGYQLSNLVDAGIRSGLTITTRARS
jgi:hypothetical protein